MAKKQKKYVTLKEASVLSGYTAAELRSFVKIGLVPSLKRKNVLYIKADAFQRINTAPSKGSTTTSPKISASKTKSLMKSPSQSLIPFTQPNRALIKVLEPVAFAAAIVMLLYVTAMPGVADGIVAGVAITERTVAFMGMSTENLIATSVAMPSSAASSVLAMVPSIPVKSSLATADASGRVAGVSTISNVDQIGRAVKSPARISDSVVSNALISIADASDAFQNSLARLGDRSFNYVVTNLSFDKLDPVIQNTFKW